MSTISIKIKCYLVNLCKKTKESLYYKKSVLSGEIYRFGILEILKISHFDRNDNQYFMFSGSGWLAALPITNHFHHEIL